MKPKPPIKLADAFRRAGWTPVEDEVVGHDFYDPRMSAAEKAQSEREIAAAPPLIAGRYDAPTLAAIRAKHRARHLRSAKCHATHVARTRTAPRARTSRRARRDRRTSCASRSGGDPPGGEDDAEALVADLTDAGGRELFELSRAYFLNLRGWDYSRWHAALNALIEQERAFTYDEGGDDVWIVRRPA